MNLGTSLDVFQEIIFSDSQNGLVLGTKNLDTYGFKTTDGGSSWNQMTLPTSFGQTGDAFFLNPGLGWVLANGNFWKYSSGTWNQLGLNLPLSNYDIYFKNPMNGWISGSGGIIWKTTDGGMTWNQQNSNIDLGLFCLNFIDSQTGWAFGEAGATLKTTNGGLEWINQIENSKVNFKNVNFSGPQKGIAVGTNGSVFNTTNGGSTWIPQNSGSGQDLLAVCITSNDKACAVGKGGTILFSTNAGSTWSNLTSPVSENLNDIAFANETKGFAVGQSGRILITTNSGANWSIHQNFTIGLEDIYILNEQKMWIKGAQGVIIHSSDAGVSWQQIGQIPNNSKGKLCFVNEQSGWAVGEFASVFKTTNGGSTWNEIELEENILEGIVTINGCHFFDAETGIVFGEIANGGFMTTDGGNTWFFLDLPLMYGEIQMYFADNQTGWTVGSNGAILKTSSGGRPLKNNTIVSEASFSVYPNPAKSFVHLKSEEPITRVELFNGKGQSLEFTLLEGSKMDLTGLTSGIYFLKIHTTKGVKTKKIVRE